MSALAIIAIGANVVGAIATFSGILSRWDGCAYLAVAGLIAAYELGLLAP